MNSIPVSIAIEDNEADPIDIIARKTNLSRPDVLRHLNWLEENGFIKVGLGKEDDTYE